MKTVNGPHGIQGRASWHAHRRAHFNASDAPTMLGISPYPNKTRSKLLHEMATGITPEVDGATQERFDRGHQYEAAARSVAEALCGEPFYPSVVTLEVDGLPLSASLDGININEADIFEHKAVNAELRDMVPRGKIPDHIRAQIEQQLLVSGATKCFFMASAGTAESAVYNTFESDPAMRARLIAGWKQFKADLADYTPAETVAVPIAAPIRDLPAIRYQLNGLSLTSNLGEFREAALVLVEDSKKELTTDEDFVNRDALNKAFKTAEEKIDLMCAQVIGEIADVDKFTRDLKAISDLIRQARLTGEKKVVSRKEAIRLEIVTRGRTAINTHENMLTTRLGKSYLPSLLAEADFAGVVKGKRTLASMNDAVDGEIARVKIEGNALADRIAINLQYLQLNASDYKSLFPDTAQIVLKSEDDLASLVKVRIADHKEAERVKAEVKAQLEAQARAKAAEAMPAPIPAPAIPIAAPAIAMPSAPLPVIAKDPDEIINTVVNMMRSMGKDEQMVVLNAAIAVETTRPKQRAA